MTLNLMYITNKPEIAEIADRSGVDWIFIDLEINGKVDRQGHLDTVISRHSINDISKVKNVLAQSKLLVRVNPIYSGSKDEIDSVIERGAEIVMLPFFKTPSEVRKFIEIIDGRTKTCLLLETPEAVKNLNEIINIPGIDYIHIGLNDLHLGLNKVFMFELLVDGTVESIVNELNKTSIEYGFGGIARLGEGAIPAEYIICEHYRLESSMAILSRTFCDSSKVSDLNELEDTFTEGVKCIRDYEKKLSLLGPEEFEKNKAELNLKINQIVFNKRL